MGLYLGMLCIPRYSTVYMYAMYIVVSAEQPSCYRGPVNAFDKTSKFRVAVTVDALSGPWKDEALVEAARGRTRP